MASAPTTSAQASASDRKIVLRAGTYVDGMSGALDFPVLRNRAVADERRTAERGEIHLELDVPDDPEVAGHGASGGQLLAVHLAVADREGVQLDPSARAIAPAV